MTMTTTINLDDPRVKRTRQLLQRAFLSLMMEGRFRDITVQEIADRATVNRATFYAHFEDKFDLLDSAIRERFKQELAAQLGAESTWSRESLRVLIAGVFDLMTKTNHHCAPADRERDDRGEPIRVLRHCRFPIGREGRGVRDPGSLFLIAVHDRSAPENNCQKSGLNRQLAIDNRQ